ncbi:hypothetical protein JB92DRAFT_3144029 [Gautieria morchelliformis]|nr:hypothetical protein JB92DRAFT_3144029 [Gautieria morchelliformis]
MSDKRFGRSTQPHQNQPSGSGQGPPAPRHNPHANPNQLVQSLRNLNLDRGQPSLGSHNTPRPPGPPQPSNNPSSGHSPSRTSGEIQTGLLELFLNPEVAARFLSSFDQIPLGQQRRNVFQSIFLSGHAEAGNRQGNKLLDLIARSDHPDIERFLNKISCVVDFMMSAEEFLARDLPIPVTTATTNSSAQSSAANMQFSGDPLTFRYLATTASQVRTTGDAFNRAIGKVKKYFYDQPLVKRVVVEGDVVDVCLTNILLPVVRFINELLTIWQDERKVDPRDRMIVSIRAQYRPVEVSTGIIYVDHVLILVKKDLYDTSSQHILVIHEAKIVKSLNLEEWDKRVQKCASEGALRLAPNSGSPEMQKMIPQVRRYVFETKCPYALLSDSMHHFGMIWDKPADWPSSTISSSFGLAGSYKPNEHTAGYPHTCQVLRGSNKRGHAKSWPARRTLAFLCYLALMDHNFGP